MKQKIINWLLGNRLEKVENQFKSIGIDLDVQEKNNKKLMEEIGRLYKLVGALYDYLGVRPQKTFVEDFSRLPDEVFPTMEIIKAQKIEKIKQEIKRDKK